MTLRTTESSNILSGQDSDRLLWPCVISSTILGIRLDLGLHLREIKDLPRFASLSPKRDVKTLSNLAISSTFEVLVYVGVFTPELIWLDRTDTGVFESPIEYITWNK